MYDRRTLYVRVLSRKNVAADARQLDLSLRNFSTALAQNAELKRRIADLQDAQRTATSLARR